MASSSSSGLGGYVVSEASEMFNLSSAMDMMGFSSKTGNHDSSGLHHHHQQWPQQTWISPQTQQEYCVLYPPCSSESQQQQQGLSLSLSSCSSIALQSFDLLRHQQHYFIKNSKYLVPAQDLLNEFCGLHTLDTPAVKQRRRDQQEEDKSAPHPPLTSLQYLDLQKRKSKLVGMLEEVERRYKHYCNQMKGVVSSFEAVAGEGAATVYSAMALKAMSRHFRSLKDGILDQIQRTKNSMGDKDPVLPGTTKPHTPRLKVIDQALRHHRAFHHIPLSQTHPWRPQRGLPERSVSLLRAWLFDHFLHPYPSDVDKHILARQTGLSRSQVSNWFINARVRLWKPMVEEMYMEEGKENDDDENNNNNNNNGTSAASSDNNNMDPDHMRQEEEEEDEEKPQRGRLIRMDSECMSSIINNKEEQCVGRVTDAFGSVEIDFSSPGAMVPYGNDANQGFHGGVSLTLGLQQHGGSGVSLAAFPAGGEGSMFYSSREQIETVHHQYSLLDAEAQTMPYRNLMGTHHMLHDLA